MADIEELMQKYDDPFFDEPRQGLSIRLPEYEIRIHTLAAYSIRRSGNRLRIYDAGELLVDMEVRMNIDG